MPVCVLYSMDFWLFIISPEEKFAGILGREGGGRGREGKGGREKEDREGERKGREGKREKGREERREEGLEGQRERGKGKKERERERGKEGERKDWRDRGREGRQGKEEEKGGGRGGSKEGRRQKETNREVKTSSPITQATSFLATQSTMGGFRQKVLIISCAPSTLYHHCSRATSCVSRLVAKRRELLWCCDVG